MPGDWGSISNKAGGFWGYWWKPETNYSYYVQFEKIDFVLKIKQRR
jgi:hypothetical protein